MSNDNDIQHTVCGTCGYRWVTGRDGKHSCASILKTENDSLREAAVLAEAALSAASRDIHEHLQVAIYNLTGRARDGFNYGKPATPALVHAAGIARSEVVEKQCDRAWIALHRILNRS